MRFEAAIQAVQALCGDGGEKSLGAFITDVDASVMKMADGGFRPAHNVQRATAGSKKGGLARSWGSESPTLAVLAVMWEALH